MPKKSDPSARRLREWWIEENWKQSKNWKIPYPNFGQIHPLDPDWYCALEQTWAKWQKLV